MADIVLRYIEGDQYNSITMEDLYKRGCSLQIGCPEEHNFISACNYICSVTNWQTQSISVLEKSPSLATCYLGIKENDKEYNVLSLRHLTENTTIGTLLKNRCKFENISNYILKPSCCGLDYMLTKKRIRGVLTILMADLEYEDVTIKGYKQDLERLDDVLSDDFAAFIESIIDFAYPKNEETTAEETTGAASLTVSHDSKLLSDVLKVFLAISIICVQADISFTANGTPKTHVNRPILET